MRTQDQERNRLFGRRAALLAGGKVVLISALVGRMYYLQVLEADRYRMLAEENRINLRLLPPPRGRILDRNGVPLAVNEQNFRLLVVSEQTDNLDTTLDALARLVPLGEADRARIHREVKRRRSFVPVKIRENLTWDEVARIEINSLDLPGVTIDVGESRHYPSGELAAHLLGYVAVPSESDLNGDPLLELPGFRIGKAGIERVYDLPLRGTAGNSQVEVNAVGRVIRELARNEGRPGRDLNLTIDLRLQEFASRRLGEESASVVVMDIHSGELLVMASTPSFDPNAFNRGLTSEEWKALISNPRSPLANKAIAGQYTPGSTFKMVVALAALESGTMSRDQRVFCPGHMMLGNAKFHCWKKGGHGSLNMVEAIKHSCDVFFYEAARRTGIDRIADMARKFGMGTPTGLDLPGERPGVVPSRNWKQATLGQPWHLGETLVNGIGQGFILATPLQMAVMTARIANGGRAVVPHLARDLVQGGEMAPRPMPTFQPIGVSPTGLAVVRQGMNAVTNEQGGTAWAARIREAGMEMSGKTGTAQVRRITLRERETGVRKNEDLPWKERDHALFVAYAPEQAPRFAIAVVVEHGGGGSAVAAPIARDIMIEVQKTFRPAVAALAPQDAASRSQGGGG
ncbi:MAG: penicillin-binding protein 2 [Rhodospirillales bacterium]|nr:penicillin-binding protein 2 [Rhodospirillales bacterium]